MQLQLWEKCHRLNIFGPNCIWKCFKFRCPVGSICILTLSVMRPLLRVCWLIISLAKCQSLRSHGSDISPKVFPFLQTSIFCALFFLFFFPHVYPFSYIPLYCLWAVSLFSATSSHHWLTLTENTCRGWDRLKKQSNKLFLFEGFYFQGEKWVKKKNIRPLLLDSKHSIVAFLSALKLKTKYFSRKIKNTFYLVIVKFSFPLQVHYKIINIKFMWKCMHTY